MIKRILVGLAGTPYRGAALHHAIELAKLHGAELTGVTVVDVKRLGSAGPAPIGAEVAAIEFRDHRVEVTSEHVREEVEAFEKACAAEDVPCHVRCEEGDAFRRMHCCSRYHDLTVFGLRSIFEYYFENEESTSLLGRLVGGGVRPLVAVASEPRPIRRVLVAYNGSMASAKSLRHFVQLRPWPDTPLRIVTFEGVEEDPKDLLANAADYCRAHGIEPEVEHVRAPARDQLLPHAAEWGADLIVMGNSRRRFILKQLFGETTLHLMQNADRPLFLSQ